MRVISLKTIEAWMRRDKMVSWCGDGGKRSLYEDDTRGVVDPSLVGGGGTATLQNFKISNTIASLYS